jgi:sterol desaturase/sphingolipid hydroxylase (fatty acid hydroxylase superfamily)
MDVLASNTASATQWAAPAPDQRRRAPRTRRVTTLVIIGAAIAVSTAFVGNDALFGIPILLVLCWPLERMWRRHPVGIRRLGLRTDLAYAVAAPLLQFVGLIAAVVVGALSLTWLPALALRPAVDSLPFWAQVLSGIVLFDLATYWTHRWAHTVPLFWRFHSIHHSSVHLDWISGIRNHPFDGVFMAPAFAFLIGAGFDNTFVGALAVVQFVIGLWAHLNVRWRLRPLHAIVLTPDFHHWHHANEPAAINTNFSVFLPLWDIVFGTYHMPRDVRPERYGVNEPIPQGIGGQLTHPFRGLRREWRAWRTSHRSSAQRSAA